MTLIEPLRGLSSAIVLQMAFSAVATPTSPSGLLNVSTCSINFRAIKAKMKVLVSSTTTSISLRNFTFLTTELKEISVLFFLS